MYYVSPCTFDKVGLLHSQLFNLVGINGALENHSEVFSLREGLNLKLLSFNIL